MSYTRNKQVFETELWQVSAHHMHSGIEVNVGSQTVYRAAPILGYMSGWTLGRVKDYCAKKRWGLRRIGGDRDEEEKGRQVQMTAPPSPRVSTLGGDLEGA